MIKIGGRGAKSSLNSSKGASAPHVIPTDKNGKAYTVSSWLKENGRRYQFDDFVVANKDRTIILDDRIAYLKSRGKSYMDSFRKKTRGRTVYDIKYTYPGEKRVVTLVLDDKKK